MKELTDAERKTDLSRTSLGQVRDETYDVVLLPWGATEPHNLHLPYLTDAILAQEIARDAALLAWDEGVRCAVLPPVPFGSHNPGQRELPFCLHARYETQRAILTDIVASLDLQGKADKLVILNGHGGNVFKSMIRDLALDHPRFTIFAGEWYRAARAQDYFDAPGDHADELETSVMMYYHPELVRLAEAGSGRARGWALPTLREGFVWTPRHWQRISDDTGVGDPRRATAAKGERFAKACAAKWAQFLIELARADDLYAKE